MIRSRDLRKPTKNSADIEKAQLLLKEAEQQNIDACGDEIEKVLGRFGCVMEPLITIRGTRIFAQMLIVANPTPNQGSQMQRVGKFEPKTASPEENNEIE